MADGNSELVAFQLTAMDKKLDRILTQVEMTNGRVDEAEKNIIRLQERAAHAEERAAQAEQRAAEAAEQARPTSLVVVVGSIASAVAASAWAAWERFGK